MAFRRSTAPASPRSCASPSSSPAKAACSAWSAAPAASATPSPSPASSKPSPPSNPNPPPSPISNFWLYGPSTTGVQSSCWTVVLRGCPAGGLRNEKPLYSLLPHSAPGHSLHFDRLRWLRRRERAAQSSRRARRKRNCAAQSAQNLCSRLPRTVELSNQRRRPYRQRLLLRVRLFDESQCREK